MAEQVSLTASEKWTVPTGHETGGLRVSLSLPMDAGDGETALLVLLDGDTMFLTATEFARTVRRVTLGELPPVAVLGIMRDAADPVQYVSSRFRDFTPRQWHLPGPFEPDNAFAVHGTGGAPGFLSLIENEVLPGARERLASAGLRVTSAAIGGWSLSGLFASWAWLGRPDLFDHLIAVSPSLWWDDASILDTPFAPRPPGQRVFVCAGEHEEGDVGHVWPRKFGNAEQRELAAMVRNAERFARMATDAGASVDHMTFADEHHVTVQAGAVTRGLRVVFAPNR